MRAGQVGCFLAVLAAGCGRTELEPSSLVAAITPTEQTVRQGKTVSWKGSASDTSGQRLTFLWRVFARPSGSTAALRSSGADAQLSPDQVGDWVVELRVSADGNTSAAVVALLHVQPATAADNHPPVADAGPAQRVELGRVVMLDGSRSTDVDGDPLTFTWTTLTAPANATVALPAGVAPSFMPTRQGRYQFQLRVTDPFGASSTATVNIDVFIGDGGVQPPDAGRDAGTDAGTDAGVDAGVRDAGPGPDVLEPTDIYIAGTLSEGACYRDALANLFTPNVASLGFDCYFSQSTAMVRPTDGRLLYTNIFEDVLREYHCDVCTFTGAGAYPANVLANDTVVPTPCPGTSDLTGFLVSVDGEVLHRCSTTSAVWRDSSGAAVHTNLNNDSLLALGTAGLAFSATRIVDWKTMTQTMIVGLPPSPDILAVRWAAPDAFFVAIAGASDELWRVSTSGVATRVGAYGALPPNTARSFGARLDGSGRLFHEGRDTTQTFTDIVVQREVGAPSVVVYTETTNPLVKLHISSLVTGP